MHVWYYHCCCTWLERTEGRGSVPWSQWWTTVDSLTGNHLWREDWTHRSVCVSVCCVRVCICLHVCPCMCVCVSVCLSACRFVISIFNIKIYIYNLIALSKVYVRMYVRVEEASIHIQWYRTYGRDIILWATDYMCDSDCKYVLCRAWTTED